MKLFGETRKPKPAYEFKRQIFDIAKKSGPKACNFLKKMFDRLAEPNNLFNQLQSNVENINLAELLEEWDKEIINPHPRSMCCKSPSMAQSTVFFLCFDCIKDISSVICYDCFIAGNHEGHRFKEALMQSDFRICYCGNTDSLKEQGFCPDHSAKPVDVYNLPIKTRDRFVAIWKLFFYFYFWLIDEVKKYQFQSKDFISMFDIYGDFTHERNSLGDILFKCLAKLASKNYESMVLCFQLLQEKFNDYPPIKNGHLSIMDHLMLLNHQPVMNGLANLAKILYPYDKARDAFLKIYIAKMNNNELQFTHAFRKITLLYIKDVNLINKLIRAKQIKPLQLNFTEKFTDMNRLASCFYKYYEDFVYINYNKKEREEFFDCLLSQVNVAHLAIYRRYSHLQTASVLNFDEFFLKVFGLMLSTVKQDTKLLEKCMYELMYEVKSFSENSKEISFSLAQQRAFAMCMVAYCNGDISRLNDPKFCKRIIEILGAQHRNKQNERKYFQKLVLNGLLSIVQIRTQKINGPVNSFEDYFHCNEEPVKCISQYLDLLYHKILLMLSRSYINYSEVLLDASTMMMKTQHKNRHQRFTVLSEFMVQMVTTDVDEMVIAEYIGIRNERRIFNFWEKLRGSLFEYNTNDFRKLATLFVNDHNLFDEFLIANPHLVSSKMAADPNSEAFPSLIGDQLLAAYLPKNVQIKYEPIRTNPILTTFYFDNIFDKKIINEISKDHSNLLKNTNWRQKYNYEDQIRRSAASLTILYNITKSEIISEYFKDKIKLEPWVECVSRRLVDQFELAQRGFENNEVKLEKIIISQEEKEVLEMKKKKERILAKKKEKDEELRRKQNSILSKYVIEKEKEGSDEEIETCIYCREGNGEGLHFIAYCNFTNTVETRALGSSSAHLFFTTCGHKVHRSCFSKHVELKKEHKCILCKKETNLIVPEISKLDINPENKQERLDQFFDSMFAVLIQGNEAREALINQIYSKEYEDNIHALMLMSIAKEMLLINHHNELHFKHMVFPIYSEIYQMISLLPLERLRLSFDIIRNRAEQKNENLSFDQSRNMQNLKALLVFIGFSLTGGCPIFQECLQKTEETTIGVARTIVKLLSENSKQINAFPISTLSLIDLKDILVPFPQDIKEIGVFMGTCDHCKTITSRILICLACGWKACIRDNNAIVAHAEQKHLEGSIMLFALNGELQWVGGKTTMNQSTIYENQFGEPFDKFTSLKFFIENKSKFIVNKKKVEQIRRSFIENTILSTIKRIKK